MLKWDWESKPAAKELDFTHPSRTKGEVMQAYNRAYREKHSGYVQCGCGSVYKEISKYTHPKCARHKAWVAAGKTETGLGKE